METASSCSVTAFFDTSAISPFQSLRFFLLCTCFIYFMDRRFSAIFFLLGSSHLSSFIFPAGSFPPYFLQFVFSLSLPLVKGLLSLSVFASRNHLSAYFICYSICIHFNLLSFLDRNKTSISINKVYLVLFCASCKISPIFFFFFIRLMQILSFWKNYINFLLFLSQFQKPFSTKMSADSQATIFTISCFFFHFLNLYRHIIFSIFSYFLKILNLNLTLWLFAFKPLSKQNLWSPHQFPR